MEWIDADVEGEELPFLGLIETVEGLTDNPISEKRKRSPGRKHLKRQKRKKSDQKLSSDMWKKLTHFVSIPCIGENFKRGFLGFKAKVMTDHLNDSIGESLFQNPAKMHLTLGVLSLHDEESKKLAVDTLNRCRDNVISSLLPDGKLEVQMSGVAVLQKNPAKANVLYGKIACPTDSLLLQHLAESVRRSFIDKGLMSGSHEVTLHVTLMNTTFRARKERRSKKKHPRTFNASDIVKDFAGYEFGTEEVTGIDISDFFSFGENGYYKPLSSITIP